MKLKLHFFALLFSLYSFAQIPAGYYTTATGTGYTLKTQLYNIIKGHTDNGYAGLYTTYLTSDRDYYYENDGTVLDMYSENPSGIDPYTYSTSVTTDKCGNYSVEGDCYNREHIIPQSVFNESAPMVSDAHSITPTDGKVNGLRSAFPHGTVATASKTTLNGSKLGSSGVAGYSGTVFEPIDEFKGDIARMYLYFATRYENTVSGYSFDMFDGSSNQVFTTAFLNMLLTWHAQDPVNAREIARNNAIYERQNNRNPYIDHPEYVQAIWNPTPDNQAPTAATNLAVTETTSSTVSLSWTAGTDNVAVTSYDIYVNGVLKTAVPGLTATITGLSATTTYSFYVIAKDAAVNSSPSSNSVNGTTTIVIPDTQNPTAASNLTVTGSSSSTISLGWVVATDNIGVTSYDVYVNSAFKTSVSGTTAIVNGLIPTTTYSFYVVAKDAAGNSSNQTNSVNGTTTTVNSTTLQVDDKNLELGTVAVPDDTTADGGGITLKGATDKTIIWDNANDNWTLNQNVNIPTGTVFKINNVTVLSSTQVLGVTLGTMAAAATTDYIAKATYDANTILAANTDNTPAAVTIAEQTIVGRKTAGNIAALTAAETMGVLWQAAPATKTSTGTINMIAKDDNFFYICTATNVWKRSAIATNW